MADAGNRVSAHFGLAVIRPNLVVSVHTEPSQESVPSRIASAMRAIVCVGVTVVLLVVGTVAAVKDPVHFAVGFAIGSTMVRAR
jgi:hypothetical protein